MNSEPEDKKVLDLRNLLAKAKKKIEQLQQRINQQQTDKINLHNNHQQKIKSLEQQSSQIMKQYEQRLLRYQQSLEQSENLVSKYQVQASINSRSNQQNNASFHQIGNITMRIFTLAKVKDNFEAVEELCSINKCKQFAQEISTLKCTEEMQSVIKCILKLNDMQAEALTKKRQARLSYVKKQNQLKRQLEEQQQKCTEKQNRSICRCIQLLSQINLSSSSIISYNYRQDNWQSKIDEISKSKLKMTEDKTNEEYIKSMLLKIFEGPKQVSIMALEVLGKVLKMTPKEIQIISKRIK